MPDEGLRGDSSIAAPGRSHWRHGILCLPRERLRFARLACAFGLLALLVSAISPMDDSVQPDFSLHFGNGQHMVTAFKLLQTSHALRPNRAAAVTTFGAHAGSVRQPADHLVQGVPTCSSSPGFERSLAARAPPACSSYN